MPARRPAHKGIIDARSAFVARPGGRWYSRALASCDGLLSRRRAAGMADRALSSLGRARIAGAKNTSCTTHSPMLITRARRCLLSVFTKMPRRTAQNQEVFTKNAAPVFCSEFSILPALPSSVLHFLCCRFCCRSPPRHWRNAAILPWLTLLVDSQRTKERRRAALVSSLGFLKAGNRTALIGQKTGKWSCLMVLKMVL
jgi:hypothetical protein